LLDHLPALFAEGSEGAAVRFDWARTLSEFVDERYLKPINAWANRRGTRLTKTQSFRSVEQAPAEPLTRLGARLRVARLRRKLRQEDLAAMIGRTRATVIAMERGPPNTEIAYVFIYLPGEVKATVAGRFELDSSASGAVGQFVYGESIFAIPRHCRSILLCFRCENNYLLRR